MMNNGGLCGEQTTQNTLDDIESNIPMLTYFLEIMLHDTMITYKLGIIIPIITCLLGSIIPMIT